MSESLDMKICIHNNCDCQGRVEWEHVWLYAGKQIQEEWAIIPCCYMHHRGGKLDKDFNRYQSLLKAIKIFGDLEYICNKYPKKDWKQIYSFLSKKYAR